MGSKRPSTDAPVWRFVLCLLIPVATWIVPAPAGITLDGWHVLGIFAGTILSFLVRPLPMGAMVLLAIVALSTTGTLKYKDVLDGFSDTTVWLVVAAFLIAGAVERTGFGRRIALSLVSFLGRSTLGLGYSICAAEFILGPVVPSNTARGGGIMSPIVSSLAAALDSDPLNHPERAGRYLMLMGAHANLITAAMFLTGMAANPLVADAAAEFLDVEFSWIRWAVGAIVPGLVSLGLLPLFIYRLAEPTIKDARKAQEKARSDLNAMEAWTRGQKIMAAVFLLLLVLWTTKSIHKMDAGLVAWIGVCILIVSRTERWEDVIANSKAWDTLFWLGGLLVMANALKSEGVVGWFGEAMERQVAGLNGVTVALAIGLIYFYSMYGFSMLTAHIAALAGVFFTVGLSAGAPPLLVVALIAYFSSLCACTTNYSTGPVIIYFGQGYLPAPTWFKVGGLVSLFHLVVWLGAGMVWWKLLGWW